MSYVYTVWRQWYDCDYYECTSLNSIWKSEEKANKYVDELNQLEFEGYIEECYTEDDLLEEFGRTEDILLEDAGGVNFLSGHLVDSYFIEPMEVRTK